MEPELPTRAWRQAATSFHMNNSCMHVWSQESYWSILLLLWSIEATSSYSSRFSHAITLWTHYIAWQWVFFSMRFLYFLIKQAVFTKHLMKFCRKSKIAAVTQQHHKLYSQENLLGLQQSWKRTITPTVLYVQKIRYRFQPAISVLQHMSTTER